MSTCRVISRANSLALQGYRHACHVMLHTEFPEDVKLFGYYPIKHSALMQFRFDGQLGFPGGFVDGKESLEEAVNREVKEEMGRTTEPVDITSDNYVITHLFEQVVSELQITKRLCLHFFAKKVSVQQFLELETRSSSMPHLGFELFFMLHFTLASMSDITPDLAMENSFVSNIIQERHLSECQCIDPKLLHLNDFWNKTVFHCKVLGAVRCPIYTLKDKDGGLPAFLRNNFVGNAREQLLTGLAREKLLTKQEIHQVIERSGIDMDLSIVKLRL